MQVRSYSSGNDETYSLCLSGAGRRTAPGDDDNYAYAIALL